MEKYDLIIVGAGPAGIFTAVELLRRGSKKHILLVEKGKPVEKRHFRENHWYNISGIDVYTMSPRPRSATASTAAPPAPSPPASPVQAPSPTAS